MGYLESHLGRAWANDLALQALDVAEGKKSVSTLLPIIERGNISLDIEEEEEEYVTTDLEELVKQDDIGGGLRWSLKCLNQAIGPIRNNFIHIFARVETGKSLMWLHQAIHMAQQIEPDEHIVIFFNEEDGKDIVYRMYSCLTGWTYMELLNNLPKAKQMWKEKIGDRIKFIDSPTKVSKNYIEKLLPKLKPRLIIIDSMDKVKGFSADRKDLVLQEIYKWGRELAKTYCPVISVGQADGTGHNTMWLDEAQMADSKTGKPAELDIIMGIGRIEKTGYENIRYIHLSKNKSRGDKNTVSAMRHLKCEVLIKPEISRYLDM